MSISVLVTIRNAMLDLIRAALDAGTPTKGKLRIYDGTPPSPGGAVTDQQLLGELTLGLPCGSAANGVLTFASITEEDLAQATGTATWGRFTDGTGTWVADFDVGDAQSNAFLKLNRTAIYQGDIIRVTAGALSLG
jgi:hypothetical protein